MTATSECRTLIQGTRLRATLIDDCGAPAAGTCSTVVTDGFISVVMSDQIEAPEEFKVKNAGGQFCVHQRSLPLLNWIDVTINLCQVQPELLNLLSGSPLVYDDSTPTTKAVGFGTDSSAYASASFALELWTNIAKTRGQSPCVGGATRYGYLLLPWLIEGTLGDITINNGPVDFSVKTITSEGNDWGVGPYDVVNTRLGVPSPLLTAIPTDRHRHMQFTSLAPPAVYCGCQDLVLAS
jgi:hypothetical protein